MPNRKNGRHWGSTSAARATARHIGRMVALEAKCGLSYEWPDRIPLRVVFHAPDRVHRDLDNLLACIKPHLDGVAAALGIDDRAFRPITVDHLETPINGGCVHLTIGED